MSVVVNSARNDVPEVIERVGDSTKLTAVLPQTS